MGSTTDRVTHPTSLRYPVRVAIEGAVPWELAAELGETLQRWGDVELDSEQGFVIVMVLRHPERHKTPSQAAGDEGETVEGDADGEDSTGPAALRLDQVGDGAHSQDVGDASPEPVAATQEDGDPQPGSSSALVDDTMAVLAVLNRIGPIVCERGFATKRLAEVLTWPRQPTNALLARMEADGLVTRERKHSRVFRIEATAAGLAALDITSDPEPGDEPVEAGAPGGAIDIDFYDRRRAAAAAAI